MVIYWYRHAHENRNDLLRYGLMQLHKKGKINYIERDLGKASEAGFSINVTACRHRHLSFLAVKINSYFKKIIVDNEDSFVHLSPLIIEADIYFTSSYNSTFYKKKAFPDVYAWQSDEDINWYKQKAQNILNNFSDQFYKIYPFVPIFDNLAYDVNPIFLKNKMINFYDRFVKVTTGNNFWYPSLNNFDNRYLALKKLRNNNLKYDVVLNDTLWGWPKHRIRLHLQLNKLKDIYRINSELKWHEPYLEDGGTKLNFQEKNFPMVTGNKIVNYEKMLSESKLGVFASGFHWGWRNIMTLALFLGIPILIDKPLFEPYFDLDEFKIFYNTSGEWDTIDKLLNKITPEDWLNIKKHNQAIYDKYLLPESVAIYFLKSVST